MTGTGGHVNPAVTLGMASVGKLSWRKVIHYFLGQYLGAFMAAVIAYVVYREAILETFDNKLLTTGANATAGIFGTFPAPGISTGTAIIDQVLSKTCFHFSFNRLNNFYTLTQSKKIIHS